MVFLGELGGGGGRVEIQPALGFFGVFGGVLGGDPTGFGFFFFFFGGGGGGFEGFSVEV